MCFRGFGPNWAASCLQDMFPKNKMDVAFDLLKAWATFNEHELSMDEISFGDDGGFPTLNCKGWDVKLVCKFLATRLAPFRTTQLCISYHRTCQFSKEPATNLEADISMAFERCPHAARDSEYSSVLGMNSASIIMMTPTALCAIHVNGKSEKCVSECTYCGSILSCSSRALRTARALRKNIDILDQCGFRMPEHMVEAGLRAARRFILGYTWLVHANYTAGRRQYKIRPKSSGCNHPCIPCRLSYTPRTQIGAWLLLLLLHLRIHGWYHVWHRLQKCKVNPKLNSCFSDEDFIRILCDYVAQQSYVRCDFCQMLLAIRDCSVISLCGI